MSLQLLARLWWALPCLMLTSSRPALASQSTPVRRSAPLLSAGDDATTSRRTILPSSPPRPPLRRDSTVIPSATAPALPARPSVIPPSSPPPGYEGASSGHIAGSPSPFGVGGLVQPSSPYQSPWIPPPTPTPPDASPYGVGDDADPGDPRILVGTLPFDEDGSGTSAASTSADDVETSGDNSVHSPSADFEAVMVPMLSAALLDDQRSSDLTTISEEHSSRMTHSTRFNSLATSGRTGSGSGGGGGRGPRDSTFSGGWETLETVGPLKLRHSSVIRQNTAETVKSTTEAPPVRAASADAARSLAADSTALGIVSDAAGPPQTLLVPEPDAQLPLPVKVSGPVTGDGKPLTPAEQIVSDEARRSPRPARRRSFSASEVVATHVSSTPELRSPFLTPVRPPRSLSRPSSSSGTLPTRPNLAILPPSDEHIATRRLSVGSDKNLPELPLPHSSPPVLSANGSSTTLQPTLSRSSAARHSSSMVDPSLDPAGTAASALSVASSAVLARYVEALGISAEDLVQHGQALSTSATEMAERARLIRRFVQSSVVEPGKVDDDNPERLLEVSLALHKAGSDILVQALDLGRQALERAGQQTRLDRAEDERTRDEARQRRAAAEEQLEKERRALDDERAALERAKVAWAEEQAQQPALTALKDDTTVLHPPWSANVISGPIAALSPGRLVDPPLSLAVEDAPAPVGSPWRLFGSAASRKARRALSPSPDHALGKPDGAPARAGGGPRKWGLKKRTDGPSAS